MTDGYSIPRSLIDWVSDRNGADGKDLVCMNQRSNMDVEFVRKRILDIMRGRKCIVVRTKILAQQIIA